VVPETLTSDIAGCRAAHEVLAVRIAKLDDAAARAPSLLPDWTRAHVLSHLARNAEAMVRRVDARQRGELIEQYEGGQQGRLADIAVGAVRPAATLIEDVLAWSTRLESTFASLTNDCWALPVRSVAGGTHPIAELPFRRWREVEVHLVDLNIGFSPADWSSALVERALPRLLPALAARTDPRVLMAWTLGRGLPPVLTPWG